MFLRAISSESSSLCLPVKALSTLSISFKISIASCSPLEVNGFKSNVTKLLSGIVTVTALPNGETSTASSQGYFLFKATTTSSSVLFIILFGLSKSIGPAS